MDEFLFTVLIWHWNLKNLTIATCATKLLICNFDHVRSVHVASLWPHQIAGFTYCVRTKRCNCTNPNNKYNTLYNYMKSKIQTNLSLKYHMIPSFSSKLIQNSDDITFTIQFIVWHHPPPSKNTNTIPFQE